MSDCTLYTIWLSVDLFGLSACLSVTAAERPHSYAVVEPSSGSPSRGDSAEIELAMAEMPGHIARAYY